MGNTGKVRTTNMYFAAYLKVAKLTFFDTVEEDKKVVFLFEPPVDPSLTRDLKRQYFSGAAQVSALDYSQAIKWAKSLTHET